MKIYAVALDPVRRAEWTLVYGTPQVPVRSAVRQWGVFPGKGTVLFYDLDVTALAPEQVARLERHLASRFPAAGSLERIRADIFGEHGVPILAQDTELVDEAGTRVEPVAPIRAWYSTRMLL